MSKRSKQRKWRRLEGQRRREQLALQQDEAGGEITGSTIGDMINRLVVKKMVAAPLVTPVPAAAIIAAQANLPAVSATVQVTPDHWPACPSSCNADEWRRAMENHDFYQACAAKEDNAKPWFQYPRFTYQYSEFVYITPEMARLLLDFNPVNRKIKVSHVEGLKRDILNHRWLQTHESIAVNLLGNMHDGQHRAEAIIKADKGWPFYVTWNVPPEALYATDSGDKRGINEKLSLLFPELKITQKTAAVCRSMMSGLLNRGVRYTESEVAAFMFKHQRVVNWTMQGMKAYRADLQAVVGKAVLWWGEGVIGPFVERLKSVQFTGDGDPAKALYLWLQTAKKQGRRTAYVSPIIYYKKALAAVHAHAAKRDTKRITSKEQDIFEWLPGWDVSEDAPCGGNVFIHSDENVA